jgi:hypothetical protein
MKKENTSRRYPGEGCQHRPDKAKERQAEAKARQDITDGLTPQQRLERLDMKFGQGQGAKKERARLAVATTKPQVKVTPVAASVKTTPTANKFEELELQTLPDEIMQEIAALNDEGNNNGKKKLKAKDRRARESHS